MMHQLPGRPATTCRLAHKVSQVTKQMEVSSCEFFINKHKHKTSSEQKAHGKLPLPLNQDRFAVFRRPPAHWLGRLRVGVATFRSNQWPRASTLSRYSQKWKQILLRNGVNQQNSEDGKLASKAKSLILSNIPEPPCHGLVNFKSVDELYT